MINSVKKGLLQNHTPQRILPFNDLQMGYRHIALKTDANFPMALPMLFIQIDVKVFFTSIHFQSQQDQK